MSALASLSSACQLVDRRVENGGAVRAHPVEEDPAGGPGRQIDRARGVADVHVRMPVPVAGRVRRHPLGDDDPRAVCGDVQRADAVGVARPVAVAGALEAGQSGAAGGLRDDVGYAVDEVPVVDRDVSATGRARLEGGGRAEDQVGAVGREAPADVAIGLGRGARVERAGHSLRERPAVAAQRKPGLAVFEARAAGFRAAEHEGREVFGLVKRRRSEGGLVGRVALPRCPHRSWTSLRRSSSRRRGRCRDSSVLHRRRGSCRS